MGMRRKNTRNIKVNVLVINLDCVADKMGQCVFVLLMYQTIAYYMVIERIWNKRIPRSWEEEKKCVI